MSASHEEFRKAVGMLQEVEQYLHQVGLNVSAKAVNEAVNKLGWEFAEKSAQQGGEVQG